MKRFKILQSTAVPLPIENVDTDQIIPKQFLKLVQNAGFGKFLFFNWAYDENKNLDPFVSKEGIQNMMVQKF